VSELAYLGGNGGAWNLGLTDLAKDQIVDAVCYHMIPLYRLVGPAAVIIILIMIIVSMVRMLLDIVVRATQSLPACANADSGYLGPFGTQRSNLPCCLSVRLWKRGEMGLAA
jgi:hypothetical protein